MTIDDQQLRDLADNLVKQGIVHSHLDAQRMASSMLVGTKNLNTRAAQAAQQSQVPSGLKSVAPLEQLEQENKSLREQLHIAQARISEIERHNDQLHQQIIALETQSQQNDQPQTVVEPPVAQEQSEPEDTEHVQHSEEQTVEEEQKPTLQEIYAEEEKPEFIAVTVDAQQKPSYDFEF